MGQVQNKELTMTRKFRVAVIEDQHATVKYLLKLAEAERPSDFAFRLFTLEEYHEIERYRPDGFVVDVMMDPSDMFDGDDVDGGFSTGVKLVMERIVPDFAGCPIFVLTGLEARTHLGAKVKHMLQEVGAVKVIEFKPIGSKKFMRCLDSLRQPTPGESAQ